MIRKSSEGGGAGFRIEHRGRRHGSSEVTSRGLMRSGSQIYNSPIPTKFQPARLVRLASAMLVLAWAARALASDWQKPCGQLAQKIVATTGPGAVAFDLGNASSLGQPDVDEIRRRLLADLASVGIHFVNADQASVTVKVTLSENLQESVWIAEIHQGKDKTGIVMVSAPRTLGAASDRASVPMTIHKALLWSDENRILDVAVIPGNPLHIVLLQGESVSLFRLQDSRWQLEQTLAVAHGNPWPRDLRGRLVLRKDHLFDAYLPGVICRSTTSAPMSLDCHASDDPWPVGNEPLNMNAFFAPTRNFFTGALSPGVGKQTSASPFYTAAALPRDKYTLWLFATLDGQIHLLDGVTDQKMADADLSEIAAIHSGCGSGWQVLAAHGAESHNIVAAFEVPDREPVPVSPPVELGGTVTALWTESDGTTAIGVSRNSETGKYEAYRLSINCGQ